MCGLYSRFFFCCLVIERHVASLQSEKPAWLHGSKVLMLTHLLSVLLVRIIGNFGVVWRLTCVSALPF